MLFGHSVMLCNYRAPHRERFLLYRILDFLLFYLNLLCSL